MKDQEIGCRPPGWGLKVREIELCSISRELADELAPRQVFLPRELEASGDAKTGHLSLGGPVPCLSRTICLQGMRM